MSTKLRLDSFASSNLLQRTRANTDALTGSTSIELENSTGFSIDDYIILGTPGKEKTEIKQIADITDNTITISETVYDHLKTDVVFKLYGNQIKVYKASNVDGSVPDDTDFSLLTTEDIISDQLFIDYTDTLGGSDYWYKQTYYNSTSTDETSITLATGARGGGYGRYLTIEEVREFSGFYDNPNVTDLMIDQAIVQAQAEIDSSLSTAGYTLPFTSVPLLVVKMTRYLATADLLRQAYDSRADDTNKDFQDLRGTVNEIMDDLISGKKNLIDEDGNLIAKASKTDYQPDSNVSDYFFKRDDRY